MFGDFWVGLGNFLLCRFEEHLFGNVGPKVPWKQSWQQLVPFASPTQPPRSTHLLQVQCSATDFPAQQKQSDLKKRTRAAKMPRRRQSDQTWTGAQHTARDQTHALQIISPSDVEADHPVEHHGVLYYDRGGMQLPIVFHLFFSAIPKATQHSILEHTHRLQLPRISVSCEPGVDTWYDKVLLAPIQMEFHVICVYSSRPGSCLYFSLFRPCLIQMLFFPVDLFHRHQHRLMKLVDTLQTLTPCYSWHTSWFAT